MCRKIYQTLYKTFNSNKDNKIVNESSKFKLRHWQRRGVITQNYYANKSSFYSYSNNKKLIAFHLNQNIQI